MRKKQSEDRQKNKNKIVTKLKEGLMLILVGATAFLLTEPILGQASVEGVMQGYENPKDIIIATPSAYYSTTSAKVSILGACDYNYPLTMNGEEIETTTLGFFTQYVSLSVGANTFTFENGGKTKSITITRKTPSTGGGSSEQSKYIAYTTPTYGTTTSDYSMPRRGIGVADVTCKPLVKGTQFKIFGEQGDYYKIFDGTFVSKARIKKSLGTLADNKVTKVTVAPDEKNNLIVAKLSMNVNALYKVDITDSRVVLTLFETVTTPKAVLSKNDTIERVAANNYRSLNRTVVYTFYIREGAGVCGYDVEYKDGVMYLYLKRLPHLEKEGSLKGATILLDAGHGGSESGAVGPMGKKGPVEKDINLNITLFTKQFLENMGATVVLTRSTDMTMSLNERVAAIRSQKPDLSLSIHCNSMPETANYALSKSFLTYYSYALGNNAAKLTNDSIINQLAFIERSIRRESLSLTRITTNPAFLIESSFMSYPWDYEYLIRIANQEDIARAAANALTEYFTSSAVYGKQSTVLKETGKYYTVAAGDSLSRIAIRYGVTINELIEENGIPNRNYIFVGQQLRIPKK